MTVSVAFRIRRLEPRAADRTGMRGPKRGCGPSRRLAPNSLAGIAIGIRYAFIAIKGEGAKSEDLENGSNAVALSH